MPRWKITSLYVIGASVILYAVFCYYAVHWQSYQNFNHAIEFCDAKYCDFALYYYEQAKIILETHMPARMYFYSPMFALLLVPLTYVSLDEALSAWGWVQLASLVLFVLSGVALMRRLAWWTHALFLALTITAFPILHNWKWGQANTLFIALVMTSLALGRPAQASGVAMLPLALAASSRYFPGIYALTYLNRAQWRVFAWFLGLTLALLFGIPALVLGVDETLEFYRASAAASRYATDSWVPASPGSQYLPSALGRVAAQHGIGWVAGLRMPLGVLSYLLAGYNMLLSVRLRELDEDGHALWAFCLLGGSTQLLLPTSWMHYFVFLPAVQAFLFSRLVTCTFWAWWQRALAGLALWLPSVWWSSIFFFNRLEKYDFYSAGGYVFFSATLMLILTHLLAPRPTEPYWRWLLAPALQLRARFAPQ